MGGLECPTMMPKNTATIKTNGESSGTAHLPFLPPQVGFCVGLIVGIGLGPVGASEGATVTNGAGVGTPKIASAYGLHAARPKPSASRTCRASGRISVRARRARAIGLSWFAVQNQVQHHWGLREADGSKMAGQKAVPQGNVCRDACFWRTAIAVAVAIVALALAARVSLLPAQAVARAWPWACRCLDAWTSRRTT